MILYYKIGKSVKLKAVELKAEDAPEYMEQMMFKHGSFALVDVREQPVKIQKFNIKESDKQQKFVWVIGDKRR